MKQLSYENFDSILERARRGERDELELLATYAREKLHAVLDNRLNGCVDRSDVVQEVLGRFSILILKFRGATLAEFDSFLSTAGKRRQIDIWRKSRHEDRTADFEAREAMRHQGHSQSTPGTKSVRSEAFDILKSAVEQLPERQREALEAQVYRGETVSETAKRLGVTENSVYVNRTRARLALQENKKLRAILEMDR